MMQRLLLPYFILFACLYRIVWTQTDELESLNGFLEATRGVHEVHLRTGIIDVDTEHQRLPSPSPSARRLLQQPNPPPTTSPEWGPLAGIQLWLLSLGPELHPYGSQQKQQQHAQIGRKQSRLSRSAPRYSALQAELLDRLRAAGCTVLSSLPPAAWMVAVSEHADLTPITEAYPGIRLAPFGPPELRIAPELSAALTVLRRAGEAAAQRLVSGQRLDELLDEVVAEGGVVEGAGWLLGALRIHLGSPTQGAARGAGLGSETDADEAPRRRIQVEVSFPHLEAEDIRSLAQGQGPTASSETYNPAAGAAADWSSPLAALSPNECPPLLQPEYGSPTVLLVSVCPAALHATVKWLAAAPQVSWLAPRMAARLHNLVSGAIVQSGGNPEAVSAHKQLSSHPFWDAGLDGRNQIVGCGDSGIDVGHCSFEDPKEKVTIKPDTNGMQSFNSATHRKIRYYLALVQDWQDGYGHGTHVSGTLVGSSYLSPNKSFWVSAEGTGHAPAAKIAFMDLSRDRTGEVWTPPDLARLYFSRTYEIGARVHSDSWGSDLTAYDSMCAALDRFTWSNPEFLSVFAAGNYGDQTARNTTVTTPAVAKNCVAVGASLSTLPYQDTDDKWVDMYSMTATLSLAGGQSASRSVRVVKASFGGDLASAVSDSSEIVLATPEDGCSSLSNAGNVRGKVVLVQRGRCYFTDKVRTAAAAEARAVIIYNDRLEGGYFPLASPDGAPGNAASLPVGGVPLSTGRWLKAFMRAGTVTVTFRRVAKPDDYQHYEGIAPYSSFGPTTDGRIKPDIVAPGQLMSAKNGTECGVISNQGTSMATPVVAASALLVRQYFMDGYYPDGKPSPGKHFTPSGALVKAVILGGAKHLTGVVPDTGMPLEDAPSYRQGFGRISLWHSLPLPNVDPGWKLQVVDGALHGAVLTQDRQHRFCVRATGGPLRITLVWYDFPAELAAARALVNDLNLQVRAASRAGLVDYGNGVEDNVNTVEQVWYDNLGVGDVAITVIAKTIFAKADKQPYALVVQGKFNGVLQPPSANSSTDVCAIQVAVIDERMSTGKLVSSRDATYHFGLQDGSDLQTGFECRLIPPDANTTSWQNCSSPMTYKGLTDGRYTFQVRVVNEEVAASQLLIVDTTPPNTKLNTSLRRGADGSIVTSSANGTFIFTADDDSTSVRFVCFLNLTNSAPNQTALRLAPGSAALGNDNSVALGRNFECRSPLAITGMGFGDYVLRVFATDEVGNTGPNTEIDWKIRYAPNVTYARFAGGIEGITNRKSLSYNVIGFKGAPFEDTQPSLVRVDQQFDWARLETLTNEPISQLIGKATWKDLESATLTDDVTKDGSYLIVVRPEGTDDNSTWAIAEVQVDTTPPLVAITHQPKSVQSDPRVSISFGDVTEGDVRVFYCRWLNSTIIDYRVTPPDPDHPPFEVCSGNSTVNVTEGFWYFEVKGKDLAGNIGAPINVSFRTDLNAPMLSLADPSPVGRRENRVVYNYTLDDGLTGTGVNVSTCSLQMLFRVGDLVDGTSEYPSALSAGIQSPCPMPARYTVQEGRYVWVISATDGADLTTRGTFSLIVDYTAPVSSVKSTPLRSGRKLPSRFTINIASDDKPDGGESGVAQQRCKLEQVSAPPPASPPPSPPSPPLPPDSRVAGALPSGSGSGVGTGGSRRSVLSLVSRRRAQHAGAPAKQQQQQQSDGPRIYNGDAVQFGEWHVCDPLGNATNVTYDGIASGYYSFLLYAVDRAGNEGNFSDPAYFFVVDASLPIDGADTVVVGGGTSSSRTKAIIIGVAVGVGSLILIAAIVAIVYVRRRQLRKRYGPQPPGGIGLQPVAPDAYGNGNSYAQNGYANGHGYYAPANGQLALAASANGTAPAVILSPTSSGGAVAVAQASPYYRIPAAVPAAPAAVAADPELAAALVASTEEERRRQLSSVAVAEQERVRAAIAASIEEENLRRAMQESLAAAQRETTARTAAEAEQAALETAIAASLASAERERQRQSSQVRTQLQQEQQQAPPSAPVGLPQESLI